MDWKSIAKSNNIEIIWVDKQYSETGSYIPKCTLYPNGAIVLPKKLKELEIEFVALHEIGHVVTGRYLVAVNERLRHLEQCKNEANANRFMLHNIV